MEMRDEIVIFLAYGISIFSLFFFGKLLLIPMKLVMRLMVNSLIGAGALALVNIAGSAFSIVIPINILTAVLTGLLGIPGVAMLLLLLN